MKWRVYLVSCQDGSLYCGASTNVENRVAVHNSGKGAKYTASRRPVVLVWNSEPLTKSAALSLEASIKKLPRASKLALIQTTERPSPP